MISGTRQTRQSGVGTICTLRMTASAGHGSTDSTNATRGSPAVLLGRLFRGSQSPQWCVLVIAAVVLVTYHPATRLNFYGDDYSFVERAGRSSLGEYLSFYFDPRVQTGWYRPMQGMLFGVEYVLFGVNPLGYHLVNIIVHLSNCLLLFGLTRRFAGWRIALIATLIYSGLPLFGPAVFWPGDADFELALFYLLAILSWVLYLDRERRWYYWTTVLCFLLAVTTKEFGVTLPVVLFMVDRMLIRKTTDHVPHRRVPEQISERRLERSAGSHSDAEIQRFGQSDNPHGQGAFVLAKRYAVFAAIWLVYLPLEYMVQSGSVLTNQFGYGLGAHFLGNFVYYLATLAFPWGLPEPINNVWLAVVSGLYLMILIRKKSTALAFLGLAGILAFVPVVPFPWQVPRYLYMSVMAFAVVLAVGLESGWTRLARPAWFAMGVSVFVAFVLVINGRGVAEAAADFAELGRQTRVPLRDISQRHPTFPEDTYLYFVDTRSPTSELSGMFFVRYGPKVTVESNIFDGRRANLREHQNALVLYLDQEQRTREASVDPSIAVKTWPLPPVRFAAPIQLLDYELASSEVKRGDTIVMILYWQATGPVDQSYRARVRLVDTRTHQTVADSDQVEAHAQTINFPKNPTSFAVDVKLVPLSVQLAPGDHYQLEIGLFRWPTMEGVSTADDHVSPANQIVIEPLTVRP